jgi:hypothetical protein
MRMSRIFDAVDKGAPPGVHRSVGRSLRTAGALVAGTALAAAAAGMAAGTSTTGAIPAPFHRHATLTAATDETTGATRGGDAGRTGWYSNQPNLNPSLVGGGSFGQIFSTSVNGAVYGQPLVDDNQLLVTTENNYVYGLDPLSGTILWTRSFGAPPLASAIGCGDLAPTMGSTGTPVVDQATNTEYLVNGEYITGTSGPQAYYMHALDLANNGAEMPGFPVQIQGTASNNPAVTFNPTYQLQRPGLLLMDGVIYVAFGSHCDVPLWQGWVAGVSEAGQQTALWTTMGTTGSSGGGSWMAGGGLVSDGTGQILFATGNRSSNAVPTAGVTPPANLAQSVIRLTVQPDGGLKPTDFFEPYDAATLDKNDLDFGSGSPIALPNAYFGTPTYPHLAVEVGKEGYVYLLNRDNLGGFQQGPNRTDAVLGRFGPNGGVWSSPSVWPGDGGWVYIPTASGSISSGGSVGLLDAYQYGLDGSGKPTLNLVGTSSDAFGFGTSAPVVTSDGTIPGSALVWTVWSPDGSGVGAQLRAYAPVPVNGKMQLVWSGPVGTASKFNPPGVAGNRLYVGTRTGAVEGFGSPVAIPVTAPSPTFPPTVVGQSSTQTVTLTATMASTLTAVTVTGPFAVGSPSVALPANLAAGATVTLPVTFTPKTAGAAGGALRLTVAGQSDTVLSLTGSGQLNGPSLTASTRGVSFGGIPPGQQSTQSVAFANNGSQPLTISAVTSPPPPYSTTGAPPPGAVLQPGAQVLVTVGFAPTANGYFSSTLTVASDGGTVAVSLTGSADSPALLAITSPAVSFGSTPVGQSVSRSFTLTNIGGTNLTITKSKPPVLGPFTAITPLPEGTTIQPGASLVESATFTPSAVGSTTDGWVITADDGQGVRSAVFSGTGILGDPGVTGWTRNGSASLSGGALQLTPAKKGATGSSFAPVTVASSGLNVSYTSTISGILAGGNGDTLVLANPTVAPTAIGKGLRTLGFGGIPGLAVVLSTARLPGALSRNFVGISDGPDPKSPLRLHFLTTTTQIPNLHTSVNVRVTVTGQILTVFVNGNQVLSATVGISPNVRLGFSASTGSKANAQAINGVSISAGGPVTVVGDPSAGGWNLNGNSALSAGTLQLTSSNLSATFTTTIGGGGAQGADGLALVLADGATAPTALGPVGGALGFSGIHGVAVALDTYQNAANPSANFVGVTDGAVTMTDPGLLHWLTTDTVVPPLRATHTVTVTLSGGTLAVSMDGTTLLSTAVTVGPNVLIGFAGGTGTLTDTHAVSGVTITAAPRSPVLVGDPTAGGWDVNGSTLQSGGATQLTQAAPPYQAGTAFWPSPVSSQDLTATFTTSIGGGDTEGADGLALVLADPSTAPTAVGAPGGGLGFAGISGIAVCLDTYQNAVNPSANFVGVTNGPVVPAVPDQLQWLSTATLATSLRATHTFTVNLNDGTLTVTMDGTVVLTATVVVGPRVLIGFTGGTGALTDPHAVSGAAILVG